MKYNYLFIHHTSILGGATKSGAYILEALNKKGIYPNILFRSGENGSFVEYLSKRSIRYNKLIKFNHFPHPLYHFNGNYHSFFSLKFLKSVLYIIISIIPLIKSLRALKPDIVIVNSLTISWISVLIKLINKNIKVICWIRETIPNNGKGLRNFFIKYILKLFSDNLIFISNFDLNQYPIPKHKKRLIYNPEKFSNQPTFFKKQILFTFLFLGGLNKLKGTKFFLEAFLLCLRNSNLNSRVILSGVNNYKKELRYSKYESKCLNLISDINSEFPDSIKIVSINPDVDSLFLESSVVVFCPNAIHQTRLIFESANNSRPIIIPEKRNLKEYVVKNAVLTFKQNDIDSLSSVMIKLVDNKYNINDKSIADFRKINLINHSFESFQKKIFQLTQYLEDQ